MNNMRHPHADILHAWLEDIELTMHTNSGNASPANVINDMAGVLKTHIGVHYSHLRDALHEGKRLEWFDGVSWVFRDEDMACTFCFPENRYRISK